jgi:hypothetical protein
MTNRTAPLAALFASLLFATAACGGEMAPQPGPDELESTEEVLEETGSTTVALTESDEELDNPERGFYEGYNLVSDRSEDPRDDHHTLAIDVVDLRAFRTGPLSSALLASLDQGFERARRDGVKIILRFRYNDDYTADAPLPLVLQHIDQLAPVIRANEDVIAVMQAGFVGAHGEWHSSTNGLDTDRDAWNAIVGALLDAVPESRSVQVRKPAHKQEFVDGTVSAEEAFSATDRARLGHHNDCFLASPTDLGTYQNPIEDMKAYVAADSTYVPTGGETCGLHERNSCANAVAEMERLHWTYLNDDYHQGVLERWVDEGCDGEIRKRLGYRFVAEQITHSERVAPGGVMAVQVDVANRGFAAAINERPVQVVLTSGGVRHVAQLDFDARRLPAGQTTTISARLRVPADLAPGTYSLALRLPDAAASLADDVRYAIQLANTGVWDDATGDNVLSQQLIVDADAPGQRDATATTFAQID